MSSSNFFKGNRCKNDQQPEAGFNKRNKMPPLLRLDSTGEISPTRKSKYCNTSKAYSVPGYRHSLKELVGGLNIPTVFETGSSCICSAASYFEGICKNRSRRDLVRSDSDTTALQYMQNMLRNQRTTMEKEQAGSFDSVLSNASLNKVDTNQSGYSTAKTMQTSEVTQSIPNSILSVFHNGVSQNKVNGSTKLKCEPYVPPPLKNHMATSSKNDFRINPRLTPYNARLLEQSRHQRKGIIGVSCSANSDRSHQKKSFARSHCPVSEAKPLTRKDKEYSSQEPEKEIDSVLDNKSSCDSNPTDSNTSDRDGDIPKEKGSSDDWFDYENNNLEFIPIHYNLLSRLHSLSVPKSPREEMNQTNGSREKPNKPSLNSWFSQELDVDVQKAIEENIQSSQEAKVFQTQCDRSASNKASERSETMCSENVSDRNSIEHSRNYIQSSEPVFILPVPQILYIRNVQSKKCRPSSKKRKRNKTVHKESDVERQDNSGKKNAHHPSNSVAFIPGIDNKVEQTSSHPFLISCDTDSDISSEWSDSSDSDLEIDGADNEPFFCAFNEPLNLFNLKVMCSVQPETCSQSSEIDAINLSWQVNVAIGGKEKSKIQKEKSSAKKVKFVEDKNLATVHRMVTWSYAYAAARKGPWEEMARDRGRFHRRITEGEKLLKSVLNEDHRDKIFKERFTTG